MVFSQRLVSPDSASSVQAIEFGRDIRRDPNDKLAHLIRLADGARDIRHWSEAAEGYRAALDIDAGAAPIWVQYGHMLKESGELEKAKVAYESALKLEANNADTYLQLGHLLKLSNKKLSAIDMYAKALELDPHLADAHRELRSLGAEERVAEIIGSEATANSDQPLTYIDVSDLLRYFLTSPTPSGIQRIVISLAEAALRREQGDIQVCAVDEEECVWRLLDTAQFLRLLALSRKTRSAEETRWKSAMAEMEGSLKSAPPLIFAKQSILIAPGAPWEIRNYFAALRKAKSQSCIRYIAFVHDLVPVMFPEYCETVSPKDYAHWLATIAATADLFVANSENTRRDLNRILVELGAPRVHCEVMSPNGSFAHRASSEGFALPPRLPDNYVLMVGTIEPRKNHMLVLLAWRQLLTELGPDQVPALVIVGKYGWCCDDIKQFLTKTECLNGKVIHLDDVCDTMLPALYRKARFSLYNSHYEGWGLPVTESLSFGKVPVLTRNSGLLESGGQCAVYFETNSVPSLVNAVRPLIGDADALRNLESAIDVSSVVRSWDEILDSLQSLTSSLAPATQEHATDSASLKLGELYTIGSGPRSPLRPHSSVLQMADMQTSCAMDSVITHREWHPPEGWGAWSRNREFEFSIVLPVLGLPEAHSEHSAPLIVYLHLLGHRETARLRWEVNGTGSQDIELNANEEKLLRVRVRQFAGVSPAVSLKCRQADLCDLQKHDPFDKRTVGIGLRSLMVCREDDLLSRLTMLEQASSYPIMDIVQRRD